MTQPDRSDLAAGLVFIAIAAAFAWAALDVRMGTLLRMGPGYFPLVLSVLLAALGALMLLRGARLWEGGGRRVAPQLAGVTLRAAAVEGT